MAHRFTSLVHAGLVLLLLALCAPLLSTAYAFSNGQAATLVLGQPNFTTGSATATSATSIGSPTGVAVDLTTGKVFVSDSDNSRVLRFASGAALTNGAAAEAVLGQPNFTSNATATTASGLDNPTGLAVDSAGRLWVADANNSRVLRFDAAATKPSGAAADGVLGQPNFTSSATGTTASGINQARGVAADSVGRLWVADGSNNRVLRFDGAAAKPNGAAADGVLGQPDFTSSAPTTTASGMSGPRGVAVDTTGRLWIADRSNNRVLRFDGADTKANGAAADGVLGQATFTTSAPATTGSGLDTPVAVVVDSLGRLWVADQNNTRVLRFDGAATKANGANADGVLGQPDFTSKASATTASGLSIPTNVAVDSANNLWVTDFSNNRALRFDAQAAQTITFAALNPKTTADAPFTVSATASSGLPVTFTSTTPAVCTVAGSTVTLVAAGTCTIAANQAGDANFLAATPVSQSFTVTVSTPTTYTFSNGQNASLVLGQTDFTSSSSFGIQRSFFGPNDVVVDPTSGKVFVADTGTNRVLRFASSAALINGAVAEGVLGQPSFTGFDAAATQSGMYNPRGLAIDSAGRLWVVDTSNNRVLRFDGAATKANGANADGVLGQPNFTSSTKVTSQSGMDAPYGVAVDSAGRLWIADFVNSRVLRFDNAAAKANGANADGVLGQTDFINKGGSTTAAKLFGPEGVAVDSAGRVWVADTFNNRVLRFDGAATKPNGANADGVLGQADFTSGTATTTQSTLKQPRDLVVDSAGRLWVADQGNNRVLRFDGAATKPNGANADGVLGQATFTTSVAATTQSGLNRPSGVTVDAADSLWVADEDNNRVLRFDFRPAQTLTFGTLANKLVGDAPFTLSATASSGLPVTFTSSTPAICTVSGSTVTLVTAGTCTITASQAGNASFNSATPVTQSFTVTGASTGTTSQTITFGPLANSSLRTSVTVSAIATSGLPVIFSTSTPTVCTVDASSFGDFSFVDFFTVGICTITANQPGNATFAAAPPVSQSFTVTKATQELFFPELLNIPLGTPAFELFAENDSDLPITFTSSTPTVCTVSGSTLTVVAAGTCTITASQPGNANYNAATPVTQSFTVTAAASTTRKLYLPLTTR